MPNDDEPLTKELYDRIMADQKRPIVDGPYHAHLKALAPNVVECPQCGAAVNLLNSKEVFEHEKLVCPKGTN